MVTIAWIYALEVASVNSSKLNDKRAEFPTVFTALLVIHKSPPNPPTFALFTCNCPKNGFVVPIPTLPLPVIRTFSTGVVEEVGLT